MRRLYTEYLSYRAINSDATDMQPFLQERESTYSLSLELIGLGDTVSINNLAKFSPQASKQTTQGSYTNLC